MSKLQKNQQYLGLVSLIETTYRQGQREAVHLIQSELVKTYWEIGKHIVEFEQDGNPTATYGKHLLEHLSADLKLQHGKGFSRSNLGYMRQFYLKYPKRVTLSHKLTWSHYYELLKIENELERSFYEQQTILENWTIRELRRQKKASLFLRLASTTDKEGLLELAKEGRRVEQPTDLIRAPYVLDFLKVPEPYHLSESELERRLMEHLEQFLLELGKGFAFIGRQEVVRGKDSDLYDVLSFIAYNKHLVPRLERANRVSVQLHDYNAKQQEFLNFVLEQYVRDGVDELDDKKLPELLGLKYKAVADAKRELGSIPSIREAFIGFQKHLYKEKAI